MAELFTYKLDLGTTLEISNIFSLLHTSIHLQIFAMLSNVMDVSAISKSSKVSHPFNNCEIK